MSERKNVRPRTGGSKAVLLPETIPEDIHILTLADHPSTYSHRSHGA